MSELKKANNQIEADNLYLRQQLDQINFELNQSVQKHQYYKSLSELKNDEIINMSNKLNSIKRKCKAEDEDKRRKKNDKLYQPSKSYGVIEELSDEAEVSDDEAQSKPTSKQSKTSIVYDKRLSLLKKEISVMVSQKQDLTEHNIYDMIHKVGLTDSRGTSTSANKFASDKSSFIEVETANNNESTQSSPINLVTLYPSQNSKSRLNAKQDIGLTDRIWLNTIKAPKEVNSFRSRQGKISSDSVQINEADSGYYQTVEFIKMVYQVLKGKFMECESLKASLQVDQSKLARVKVKLEDYRNRILANEDSNRRQSRRPHKPKGVKVSAQYIKNLKRSDEEDHGIGIEEEEDNTITDVYVDDFDLQLHERGPGSSNFPSIYKKSK